MKLGTRFVLVVSLVLLVPLAVVLAIFGAPHGYSDVGNFGSLVAALLSFVSVLLLLNSLQAQRQALIAQAKANEQARTAALVTAQLQALSTLIAEDRGAIDSLLDKSLPEQPEAAEKQKRIFRAINKRRRMYRSQLDALMQKNFNLGAPAGIEHQEAL